MNASIYQNLGFDLSRDIAPVATLAFNPGVMEVRPSFPAGSVQEFIAYAKSNPGKVTMATSGSGSPPHVWGEMFKMMAGVDLIPVPYRGGSAPALADLMGGQVDVTFDPLASSIELIRAGKIKPLAVTSAQRSKMLPQIPAIGEFVAGYDARAWIGLGHQKARPRRSSAGSMRKSTRLSPIRRCGLVSRSSAPPCSSRRPVNSQKSLSRTSRSGAASSARPGSKLIDAGKK